MRQTRQFIASAVLALVAHWASAATIQGRVVAIADGDTVTVLDGSNQQHKIRLAGIDAPEKAQPYGQRPGEHSQLIKAIVEDFAARFAPGSALVYVGDTGDKWGYFDTELLARLGVTVDNHGKMPDVVLYFTEKNWLLLVESVTSHGPVDSKRHEELAKLFAGSKAGLVYVSAFPTRRVMNKYLEAISWESEVWCADSPTHLIHFNGVRFLGPY